MFFFSILYLHPPLGGALSTGWVVSVLLVVRLMPEIVTVGDAVGCADNCMFDGKSELRGNGGLCTRGRIGEEGDEGDNGADDWLTFDCGDDKAVVLDGADEARAVPVEVVLSPGWLDDAVSTCEIDKKRGYGN